MAESVSSGVSSMESDKSMEKFIGFNGLGVVLCDVCSVVPAVKFCQTCSVNYCESHVRQHYTVPKLQRHTLVEVTGDLEENLCQEHHRPLEVFCKTDQIYICSLCSATKHIGHDTIHDQMNKSERQQGGQNYSAARLWKRTSSEHSTLVPKHIAEIQPAKKNDTFAESGKRDTPPQDIESAALTEIEQNAKATLNPDEERDSGDHVTNSVLPPPDHLTVDSVDTTSATVNWKHPPGLDQTHHQYQISYHCNGTEPHTITTSTTSITLSDLRPATEYSVTVWNVLEDGVQSQPEAISLTTKVPAPGDLTIEELKSTSLTVRWTRGSGLDQTPQHFLISYSGPGEKPTTEDTDDCYRKLSDLQPGTQYTVSVSTVLESEPVSTTICTGSCLNELLSEVGLQDHYEKNKLKLSSVLEIKAKTTSDEPVDSLLSLPGAFLKKLMMANVNARSVKCISTDQDVSYFGIDNLDTNPEVRNVMNPLDLITALFLCSDGFLQQEMVQKMCMCQFAVPLLLPNCDTKQSTLMLWALRDIVKKYRPSSQLTQSPS
ncbi:hypothetical protein DPEC_G00181860 [Dallia pectoralis]|uniref:Uncharacterized protein n=1 Tax=Dallia pectoralis TaxID=75939 RepID=A0ACC2GAS3_DALPE|nr:hypothetical protein DPEC_G00181860 [Dallia pectoralis]